MVWLAENCKKIMPAAAGAVTVRLLNVFVPVIGALIAPVNVTLLYVSPPPLTVTEAPAIFI